MKFGARKQAWGQTPVANAIGSDWNFVRTVIQQTWGHKQAWGQIPSSPGGQTPKRARLK